MDMVERVARAIHDAADNPFGIFEAMQDMRTDQAKAAIRAMLEGQEPVAWQYTRQSHQSTLITRVVVMERDADRVALGYTETPLYDLSALKEVVG